LFPYRSTPSRQYYAAPPPRSRAFAPSPAAASLSCISTPVHLHAAPPARTGLPQRRMLPHPSRSPGRSAPGSTPVPPVHARRQAQLSAGVLPLGPPAPCTSSRSARLRARARTVLGSLARALDPSRATRPRLHHCQLGRAASRDARASAPPGSRHAPAHEPAERMPPVPGRCRARHSCAPHRARPGACQAARPRLGADLPLTVCLHSPGPVAPFLDPPPARLAQRRAAASTCPDAHARLGRAPAAAHPLLARSLRRLAPEPPGAERGRKVGDKDGARKKIGRRWGEKEEHQERGKLRRESGTLPRTCAQFRKTTGTFL
jgi:hypothetical protein